MSSFLLEFQKDRKTVGYLKIIFCALWISYTGERWVLLRHQNECLAFTPHKEAWGCLIGYNKSDSGEKTDEVVIRFDTAIPLTVQINPKEKL